MALGLLKNRCAISSGGGEGACLTRCYACKSMVIWSYGIGVSQVCLQKGQSIQVRSVGNDEFGYRKIVPSDAYKVVGSTFGLVPPEKYPVNGAL